MSYDDNGGTPSISGDSTQVFLQYQKNHLEYQQLFLEKSKERVAKRKAQLQEKFNTYFQKLNEMKKESAAPQDIENIQTYITQMQQQYEQALNVFHEQEEILLEKKEAEFKKQKEEMEYRLANQHKYRTMDILELHSELEKVTMLGYSKELIKIISDEITKRNINSMFQPFGQ